MTQQEVFNASVSAILAQGQPGWNTGSSHSPAMCAYHARTEDGRTVKCAVGILMPDWLSSVVMNVSADGLIADLLSERAMDLTAEQRQEARAWAVKMHPHHKLLSMLQNQHDDAAKAAYRNHTDPGKIRAAFIERFRQGAEWVAESLGLDTKVVAG